MGRTMLYRVIRYPWGLCPVYKMMGLDEWDITGGIRLCDIHRSSVG